jgi:hypothetical protein
MPNKVKNSRKYPDNHLDRETDFDVGRQCGLSEIMDTRGAVELKETFLDRLAEINTPGLPMRNYLPEEEQGKNTGK